jgi:hypothetical protein
MRREIPLLLSLLLVGACETGGAPPSQPLTAAALRAGFPARGIADTIVVSAADRLPLRAAELVAPDGTATAASSIDVTDTPAARTGQTAAATLWQSSASGPGGAPALAAASSQAGALGGQVQLLAILSTADIALPDPVAYRHDWQKYHLRLTFGTPPDPLETRDIPAPEPPLEPSLER